MCNPLIYLFALKIHQNRVKNTFLIFTSKTQEIINMATGFLMENYLLKFMISVLNSKRQITR